MHKKKGQVSTEYLVILAVVLVIALVVVYLVSQSGGGVSSALEQSSKTYWRGTSPLAVTDYSASGTTLTFTMKNMDPEKLTVTNITGDDITAFNTATTFNVGEQKSISLTLAANCGTAGSAFDLKNFTITYSKGSTTNLKQVGARSIVGRCG